MIVNKKIEFFSPRPTILRYKNNLYDTNCILRDDCLGLPGNVFMNTIGRDTLVT